MIFFLQLLYFVVIFLSIEFVFCCKITRLEDSFWYDQVHRALASGNFIWMFESAPAFFRKERKDWNYVEGTLIIVSDIYEKLMLPNSLNMILHYHDISLALPCFLIILIFMCALCSYSWKCWHRGLMLTSILILFYWRMFCPLEIGGNI